MRQYLLNIILLFLGFTIIYSCSQHQQINRTIFLADSIMEYQPDSAFKLLKTINQTDLSVSENAKYALLLAQAQDKTGHQLINDSLILIAINHYDHLSKDNNKAKAYFYLGRFYQNNNDYAKAINSYLIAEKATSDHDTLLTLIYDNLGTCYKNQDFYDKALEVYKDAYYIYKQYNSKNILYPLRGMASIYAIQEQFEKALKYYQTALTIASSTNDSTWQSILFCDISRIYDNENLYEAAYSYIVRSIQYAPRSSDLSAMYFWKGEILHNLNQLDSAFYYINLAKKSSDLNTQASAYQALYEIKKEQGELNDAILYNDTSLILYDSIQDLNHSAEISHILKQHATETLQQAEVIKRQKHAAFLIVTTLLLIACITFIFLYKDNKRKKVYIKIQCELRNNQIEKDELKEQIKTLIDSNTYIAERNKELKKEELKQQQVELWRRTLQICTRLFHTSTSYKKLHAIETAKFKKEKEEKQKEINSIQKEINEVFIEAIQDLREQYPKLTQEDLFYCILQYLRLSTSTIKFCMRVESNQALTQRKYRIKKQISPQTFSIIFNENSPSEGIL